MVDVDFSRPILRITLWIGVIAAIISVVSIYAIEHYYPNWPDSLVQKEKRVNKIQSIVGQGTFEYQGKVLAVDSLSADSSVIYSNGQGFKLMSDKIHPVK